ncbi:unnamed protein product [Phytophthora fragariaefolia]|uniref:Unnamed protein product n=1 Tax=Phytophthora fragariaefolia TaxID=1490495 RepID=A0A9W6YEL8_9STRA|nr:unnamed protein product [Phytophthora fragariaefolia]
MKVPGFGGVPTYISAHAEVKITHGPRVVYIFRLWVANIGEGVDVLLGMDFMFSAGGRLSTREGLIQLPDEETILMYGGPDRSRMGLDIPRDVVWAGRGDRWVTKTIYASQSWPTAVKVVNISDKLIWIDMGTDIARIVEYGFYPRYGRFVRPGTRQYQDWQQFIYENTLSAQAQIRADRLLQLMHDQAPPCVPRKEYPWPSKIMLRPTPGTAQVRMVQVNKKPKKLRVIFTEEDTDERSLDAAEPRGKDVGVQTEPDRDEEPRVQDAGVDTRGLYHAVNAVIAATPSGDDASSERRFPEVADQPKTLNADLDEDAVSDFPSQGLCEYTSTEVRGRLMAQLGDQLTMLPELQDLSPECKIDEADVSESGVSTPEMETKLRKLLKYHRKIFLGDGNAAPAPARGVVCDLDVGNVRPVAQRARQIAPHLLVKVYELLKKHLETGLIEHSESEWASPIVIVHKKNGVDIRMCIDYRVVNDFIKLLRYPLPLIDDLLIGFESAMWFMSQDMASGFWAVLMTERAKLVSAFICPFGYFQWIRMSFGLKNAPLIYQAVINNCLCSYIDDIAHGAPTWDQLYEDLNALLFRLRYWNISVSLPKSEFGKLTIPYLSHEISAEGIRATPKIAKSVQDLPFPSTLKGSKVS